MTRYRIMSREANGSEHDETPDRFETFEAAMVFVSDYLAQAVACGIFTTHQADKLKSAIARNGHGRWDKFARMAIVKEVT